MHDTGCLGLAAPIFVSYLCILTKDPLFMKMDPLVLEVQPPVSDTKMKRAKITMKEESEKVGLKLNIQKTKIMASGPIISWEMDGETVTDFIFWGSKITSGGDCRKGMTNLDSILKSTDITLPTKVRLVKAMVFRLSCMDARVGL